ncbi:hypothetical protein [Sphingorhabdus sp. Alg239-R122]|nr:hypothetical protein [Sphingorhabdus sp. Alg239-R122]
MMASGDIVMMAARQELTCQKTLAKRTGIVASIVASWDIPD